MKVKGIILLVACTAAFFSSGLHSIAQTNEISMTVGVNVPLYKGVESDAVIGLSYGHFYPSNLGFRAGLQYSPSLADVNDHFGLPLAVVFKTRTRTSAERFYSGTEGAMASARSQGLSYGTSGGDFFNSLVGGFLLNMFSDVEFFAGVTPGVIAGKSSAPGRTRIGHDPELWRETWTERKSAFQCTLDTGMCLNYSIWRFDLKLRPAFHYNLSNSLIHHVASGVTGVGQKSDDVTPLRWTFTMGGGLAFRF